MWQRFGTETDECVARRQILAFVDEYCRDMTLQDAREWYADAFLREPAANPERDPDVLNPA